MAGRSWQYTSDKFVRNDADESIGKNCATGLKVVDGKSIMNLMTVRSSPVVNNPNAGKGAGVSARENCQ
jgi:hypothetical protein